MPTSLANKTLTNNRRFYRARHALTSVPLVGRAFGALIVLIFAITTAMGQAEPGSHGTQDHLRVGGDGKVQLAQYDYNGIRSPSNESIANFHLRATRSLLCRSAEFRPVLSCIGGQNLRQLFGGASASERAAFVYMTTALRLQATQLDKVMGHYEFLVNRVYRDRLGSMDRTIERSGAMQHCVSYFDPRSRSDAIRAISCQYPMPQRFDFEAWLRSLAPGLDAGDLIQRVTALHRKYGEAHCGQIIQSYEQGNRFATFNPVPPRSLSREQLEAVDSYVSEIAELKRAHSDVKDDINFMLTVLDGDCDRYYQTSPN
ncbi:hypothetical protein [Methylopila sp. M107]|uniref:hypothetical protein n=1 Tax=Methylopila sp. M107 TaxID=1101190 RepID=UPI0012DFDFA5|nr:hypothetical protein [Methylopila sp. M107]